MGLGLGLLDFRGRSAGAPGPPPPLRLAKGTANAWDQDFVPALSIPNVSLAAGSTLVVFLSTMNCPVAGATPIKWGTQTLTKIGEQAFAQGEGLLSCWMKDNVVGGTADLTKAAYGGGDGLGLAMWAVEIQNVQNPSIDARWLNAGAGTDPIVTATVPTAQANEILLAAVGDNGQAGQPLGAWGHGFAQGQTDGTIAEWASTAINEGYRVVDGIGTFTADDVGRGALDWAMILLALKGN